jgi:hypothetical protein
MWQVSVGKSALGQLHIQEESMDNHPTAVETTTEYLEIVGYAVAAKERHDHRGRRDRRP